MDNLNLCVFPPNKPLEPRPNVLQEPKLHPIIFFIEFNEKGQCIVGSSDIESSYWEGSLLLFDSFAKFKEATWLAGYSTGTSSCGKFLNNNTVAIVEDTGLLTVTNTENSQGVPTLYFRHIQRIGEVSVCKGGSQIVSCSGQSVLVWDVNATDSQPSLRYDKYHDATINSVDVQPNDANSFVTGSQDRRCYIWDTRDKMPASVLYKNDFSAITNVKWLPSDGDFVVCSTQAGDVYTVDKRQPKDFVSTHHCYNNTVKKLAVDNDLVAVAGYNNQPLVLAVKNGNFEPKGSLPGHSQFVRGVTWFNKQLYSCANDIMVHTIS